jgi:hypothetical protein
MEALTDALTPFLTWAWERHHNILSWYIRPLFLIPVAYFAYRRSAWGIVASLVACATSMFWFPKPDVVDPRVLEFLRMEEEYLTGGWTPAKVAAIPVVPALFALLIGAFWRRNVFYGLAVIDVMAITKMVWSVASSPEGGMAVLPPALIGLAICNAAVYLGARRFNHQLAV